MSWSQVSLNRLQWAGIEELFAGEMQLAPEPRNRVLLDLGVRGFGYSVYTNRLIPIRILAGELGT